ncbi:MAG: hypothetical protein JWR61_1317 [Ferruginibacter sp.]|nr:hypothetical protein [Ferruginibacter sp.]
MFESIIMRPNSDRNYPLDYGQLIENLFFYKNTSVHIGRAEIKSLFDLTDLDVIIELLKHHSLNVYYNNSHTGIINKDEIRSVDSFGLSNFDLEKELYQESFDHGKDALKSKKFAKKLSSLIKVHELPQPFNLVMNEQLKDDVFRNRVVAEMFKNFYPDIQVQQSSQYYNIEFLNDIEFKIHTNIDFKQYDKISIDGPVLAIINGCEDLHVMSENKSEISLPEFNSRIIRLKINSALEKRNNSQVEIDGFNEKIFKNSWALREAINSRTLLIKGALRALEKAEKYKDWLQDLPDNSDLMYEYLNAAQEKSVLEGLPGKTIRFFIFNTIGVGLGVVNPIIGIPAGIAVAAFDTFILDHLIKSWTPNQFIEKHYKPLITND